jgi:Ni2+-binding GTPase involved in maturation of urease and hydrogenase
MAGAKILSLRQLKAKKYKFLSDIPDPISQSFGQLVSSFVLLVYGASGNGKSNLMIQLMKALAKNGKCLYIALEEGHGISMQLLVNRHLSDEYSGKIVFADHTMTYDRLRERLRRQRSEQFLFIDSVQYWRINYEMYVKLKEEFSHKTFIFVSHAEGKNPLGKTAKDIEYDATIKIRVEGCIGFIRSRLGGNKPYVIWEEGARRYWGDKEFEKITGIKPERKRKTTVKNEKVQNEKNTSDEQRISG